MERYMSNVSFSFLDRRAYNGDPSVIEYASTNSTGSTEYSYISSGGDAVYLTGTSLADDGSLPVSGTVEQIAIDFDNDGAGSAEIIITGLSFDITDLGIGAGGSSSDLLARFWETVLGGNDTFDFTFSVNASADWSGDGAFISDGLLHVGGNDVFAGGGAPDTFTGRFPRLVGDYISVDAGQAVGGDDTFTTAGVRTLVGDFIDSSTSAEGGNDIFTPTAIPADSSTGFSIYGDVESFSGSLVGGNDFIDLRSATILPTQIVLVGDAATGSGSLTAGNDTIHGSQIDDEIYGDMQIVGGASVTGGADMLFGYDGNDTLDGGAGADSLDGGKDNDVLFGGDGNDLLIGSVGNDTLAGQLGDDTVQGGGGDDKVHGNGGNDKVYGGSGNDKLTGSAGADTLNGGDGNDEIFGNADGDKIIGGLGNDKLVGLDGDDSFFAGAGFDTLKGGAGNDTLTGGGDADEFEFDPGTGLDVVTDFSTSSGDAIFLKGFGAAFDEFADVQAAASQVGADTIIDLGGGSSITLLNVSLGDLSAGDFLFG
jgi:Ca2+-binding RTX toxin-like protein